MKHVMASLGILLTGPMLHLPVMADSREYVIPEETGLTQGRDIWMSNCESCHGYGVADAPIPKNPEEWNFRIAKGKQVLYEHAINGFLGPDYSLMPARGGNDDLSDEEVKLAVDYMVFLASYHINKLETKRGEQ